MSCKPASCQPNCGTALIGKAHQFIVIAPACNTHGAQTPLLPLRHGKTYANVSTTTEPQLALDADMPRPLEPSAVKSPYAANPESVFTAKPTVLPAPTDIDETTPDAQLASKPIVPLEARPTSRTRNSSVPDPDAIAQDHLDAILPDLRDPKTGAISPAFAPDHSWIVGRLEYLHMKKQWRVRYVPCDLDDPYGGILTLTGIEHLHDQLRDHLPVRLHGQLVQSADRRASPAYFVHDLKVIK